MNKGTGKTWRDTYFVIGNTIGTWSEYTDTLKSAFRVYDAEGTNLLSLFGFKQGNKSTTKFVTKFVALYMKAGLRDTKFKEDGSMKEAHDARTLITLFQPRIRADLHMKILAQPTLPTSFQGWAALAMQLDSQNMVDVKRFTPGCGLNQEERDYHAANRLCFYCHKAGHRSRQCLAKMCDMAMKRRKEQGSTASASTSKPRSRDDRSTAIRALFTECADADERINIYNQITEMDF
ncbi:hypothetical protein DAEQUDRAFT_770217 [Daedalea quercina L-15889]|uniref:CCHC-type domain-containing protein n=1 Tax=Daedalea quercina L-15889 TaxID=1314783 RepID=A0A165L0V6_9APHY|nr:hypothetical protein DAEQUDRAFT_770217 [Daedalea quercina L-15889]